MALRGSSKEIGLWWVEGLLPEKTGTNGCCLTGGTSGFPSDEIGISDFSCSCSVAVNLGLAA